MKNCINCGAPIVGAKCEFCGTRYDIAAIKSKISEVQLHTDGRNGLWNYVCAITGGSSTRQFSISEAQLPHHKHSGLWNIEAYDASRTYRNLDLVRFNGQLCVVVGGELRSLRQWAGMRE